MELPEVQDTKNQRKTEIIYPQSLSPFKHTTVTLNQLTQDQFPISFDTADQSMLVDYQWDGKSIAQAIMGDKKIFLKSSDPQNYNFLLTKPLQTGDLNVDLKGKFICQESVEVDGTALMACSFKIKKNFKSDKFCFDGKKITNEGSFVTNNCNVENCQLLLNKNLWVNNKDCYLKQVGKLITTPTSVWTAGGTWGGNYRELHLEGNSSVGSAAVFGVESKANFNGTFEAPILYVESKGDISSTPQSKFLVSHHLGLKAKELLEQEGAIVEKLQLEKAEKDTNNETEGEAITKLFQRGIFLQSENGNVHKKGIIAVNDKQVYIAAKKDLLHDQLTDAGKNSQASILMAGENITLENDSTLKGFSAQLKAQESILQQGKVELDPSQIPDSNNALANEIEKTGLLAIGGKKITTTESSQIKAKTVCMGAEQEIIQKGAINAQNNILQVAPKIQLAKTSFTTANNASLIADEMLSQEGKLHIDQVLMMRAKRLYNFGEVTAQNAHLKADRWFLNTRNVGVKNELIIDAVLLMNALPGWIQAKNIQTNAIFDVNLLGCYKAQNYTTNAIVDFNAGLRLPQFNSWNDLFSTATLKTALDTVVSATLPAYTQPFYSMKKTLLNLPAKYRMLRALYMQLSQLSDKSSGLSDVVPLLAQASNLTISTIQETKSATTNLQKINSSQTKELLKNITASSARAKTIETLLDWKANAINSFVSFNMIRSLAEALAPSQNRKALIDFDCGITVSCNGNSMNVWNSNTGATVFANGYKLNTCCGNNEGLLAAPDINIYATNNYTNGSEAYIEGCKALIEAENLGVKGTISTTDAISLKAEKQLQMSARATTGNIIAVSALEVDLQKNSHIKAKRGNFVGDTVTHAATLNAEQVNIEAKKVTLKEDSRIQTGGSDSLTLIKADSLTAEKGAHIIDVDNQNTNANRDTIVLITKNTDLQKDSVLNGGNGAVKSVSKQMTNAAHISGKSIAMQAEEMLFKDGCNMQAHGKDSHVFLHADTFKAESKSKVAVVNNTPKAPNSPLDDNIVLLAKKADLEKESVWNAGHGTLKTVTKEINNGANIIGQQIAIQSDEITLKDGSHLKTQGADPLVVLQANTLTTKDKSKITINDVSVDGKDAKQGVRLILEAKTADLQKGSELNAGNSAMKSVSEKMTNAARISGKSIAMQAEEMLFKDGCNMQAHGKDSHVFLHADTFKAESKSKVAVVNNTPKAPNSPLDDNIVLLAKKADLEKESVWNAGHGALKTVTKEINNGANIIGQQIAIQSEEIGLKDGSNLKAIGIDPLVVLQAQKLVAENNSKVAIQETDNQTISEQNRKHRIILHAPIMDLKNNSCIDPSHGVTAIVSDEPIIAGTLKGAAEMTIKNLTLAKDSDLDLKKLTVNAEEKISLNGKLNALEFYMRGKYVENSGKLSTKKGRINADRWYWNTGDAISQDTLNIDTPVSINWRSYTEAKHLTTNALVDINLLSWDKTITSSHNALFSLDLSLHLPLSMAPKDLINLNNLQAAGETALYLAPPPLQMLYKIAKLVYNTYGMANQGLDLFRDIKALYANPNAGASDWVPLINRAVSLALSAKQAASAAKEMSAQGTALKNEKDNSDKNGSSDEKTKTEKNSSSNDQLLTRGDKGTKLTLNSNTLTFENLKNMTKVAIPVVAPFINQNCSRTGLIDFNLGPTLGFNGSSMNLWDVNAAKVYANYNLDTCYGKNIGLLAASHVSIKASKYENGSEFNIGKYHFTAPAHIAGQDVSISAKHVDLQERSGITTNALKITAQKIDQASHINGQRVQLQAKDITLKNGSTTQVRGPAALAAIQANNFTAENGSKMVAQRTGNQANKQDNIILAAKNANLKEGSQFNAGNGAMKVNADQVSNAANITGQLVNIQAQEIKLNDGSDIKAQGDDPRVILQAKKLIAENNSKVSIKETGNLPTTEQGKTPRIIIDAQIIDLNNGSNFDPSKGITAIVSEQTTIDANLKGEAQIETRNLALEKNSDLDLQKLSVNATEKISLNGNLNATELVMETKLVENSTKINEKKGIASTVYIKADSFKGTAESTIHGTVELEVNEIDNKGTMHGSTSLKFTGQPDQLKDIGSVNTHGGSFSYNGPIASTNDTNVPSADELVRGAGSWGTVTNASMISLDLNNHDAHIKNKHDLPHSLEVKTNGAIQTDQPIGSKGSMAYTAGTTLSHASLSAEKFIARNAGEDIIATSQKEHIHNGKNYEDVIKQTSVVAGTANTACAGRNIIQTAVEIKSGKEGTHLIAGNEIIDDALAKETHTEKKYEDSGWFEEVAESTKDTHIKPQVCHYKSEGNVIIQAGKKYTGNATIMDAKGEKKIIQAPMVEMVDVKNTHLHESENEERTRGWSATTSPENTMTSQSVGPQFISNGTSPFIIESENTKLVNPQSDAPLVLKGGRAQILLGENKNISIGTSDYSNWLWENEKSHAKMDITYSKLKVPGLENHTKELIIQSVVGETTNFLHKIQKMGDGTVSKNFVEEFHSNDQTSSTRLTTASHIVLGLSFSLLTSGIGTAAGIGAALTSIGVGATTSVILANMTTAALTSLLNNAANHIVESEGDILKAAARMASSDTFKSAALAALSAGAIAGADQALNLVGVPQVQDAVNFSQRLAYAAPRELVHAGIRTGIAVLANQPLREAFTQNITEVAAKTLHTALVGQIADLYGTGQITGPIHKVLHTGAGALYGGIIGGTNGAVAGGLGALTAEVAAEILAPSKQIMETITTFETKTGHSLSQQEFMAHYANALQNYVEKTLSAKQTAQFVATITTLAAGQDVEIAQQSAATALDNNFLVLAAYGITAASTAYSAYNIYKSYENEGAIAGLKQLGIEIAYNAAGHAIGRVGGMVYPSIKAATIAALDEMPAIKMLLGDVAEQLVIAAEKINQTSIGQAVSKVEAKLMEQEAKLLQKLGIKGAAQSKNYGQEQTSTIESAAELTEKEVYAVTPEGIVVKVPKEAPELGVLRESKNVSKQGSKAATQASAQISGEKILPKMKTYDEARNKALELIGKVDSQSGIPHIGRIKACKDKLCGMRWENDKVIIRLDYDPVKGPHLNVDDYRKACSNSFVVPFEGDEKTVKSLLKHLNTKASLEQAKSIYNQTNNEKDLCRITDMIKNFNKKKNKYEK